MQMRNINLKTISRISTLREVRLYKEVSIQLCVFIMLVYLYTEFRFFVQSISHKLILS